MNRSQASLFINTENNCNAYGQYTQWEMLFYAQLAFTPTQLKGPLHVANIGP